MHPIYPASLAAALYPRQAKSNRDRGASADGTAWTACRRRRLPDQIGVAKLQQNQMESTAHRWRSPQERPDGFDVNCSTRSKCLQD
jgi:hypothetical protein